MRVPTPICLLFVASCYVLPPVDPVLTAEANQVSGRVAELLELPRESVEASWSTAPEGSRSGAYITARWGPGVVVDRRIVVARDRDPDVVEYMLAHEAAHWYLNGGPYSLLEEEGLAEAVAMTLCPSAGKGQRLAMRMLLRRPWPDLEWARSISHADFSQLDGEQRAMFYALATRHVEESGIAARVLGTSASPGAAGAASAQ